MTIRYTCQNEDCEHEFEVSVTGGCEAKLYGPPEHCHPAESPDVEPDKCPECGREIDTDKAIESAHEAEADARDAAAEDRAEAREEDRRSGF